MRLQHNFLSVVVNWQSFSLTKKKELVSGSVYLLKDVETSKKVPHSGRKAKFGMTEDLDILR